MKRALIVFALLWSIGASAGMRYINPILHQDWSDPDVCQVGDYYYMTASSFNYMPGLPILRSQDLVNWEIIGAALYSYPLEGVEHGRGVWAPSIRFHDGWFYIFAADPDRGIFMVRTQDPAGPWEEPVWLWKGKGYIDPCPLWDDDGKAYLSHAAAGSRAGIKSVILVAPMAPDGTKLLGPSRIVYDGHDTQPTIEGTKFYKKDGRYYIFCPAGGVATGWQTVLRSYSPWGPWEEKVVMAWAPGTINGPHQGAWVSTASGDWFLHFQDKGAYGRIVHLQPLEWRSDGWPIIGEDPSGDGVGQPVDSWEAPLPLVKPQASGVPTAAIGQYGLPLYWQYPGMPSAKWHCALPDDGIRLFSVQQTGFGTLWDAPNVLSRSFPAESFLFTAQLTFQPITGLGESCGFGVFGSDYTVLRLTETDQGAVLQLVDCQGASKGAGETVQNIALLPWNNMDYSFPYSSGNVPAVKYPSARQAQVWVRLQVRPQASLGDVPDASCQLFWSTDGREFTKAGYSFPASGDQWTGARLGFFCLRGSARNDCGRVDITNIDTKPEFSPTEGFVTQELFVPDYKLPDPLKLSNGRKVKDAREWEAKRRPELLKLFEKEMFGKAPAKPKLSFQKLEESRSALGGTATRRQVRIKYADKGYIDLLMYIPNGVSGPVPTFLGLNFMGNHSVSTDPGILMPDTDRYARDFIIVERGGRAHRWPLEMIVNQGYAVATFCCEDVAPDTPAGGGARDIWSSYSWGNISAWAWGLSIALDYLETDTDIDASKVAVIGHSRFGKAALWAGAQDTRFAMVVSNESGCGGAAISRRCFGETIRRINSNYPHWFTEKFKYYNDNEESLPFDQHELLALIAPRPLYVGSANEDLWSDPTGEYLGLCGAAPVYALYGYKGFTEREMPATEDPKTIGVCGYHIRTGRHAINSYDWEQYLAFASKMLK